MAQVIEISDIDAGPAVISLNRDDASSSAGASSAISAPSALKSVNFGGGLDLLMNDKKVSKSKSSGGGTDINLEDLKELEDDLNNLSADISGEPPRDSIKAKSKSGLFKSALGGDTGGIKLNIGEKNSNSGSGDADGSSSSGSIKIGKPILGKATANTGPAEVGLKKFANIPIDPDKHIQQKLSPEELLKEKFTVLRKLEALEAKGVKLTKRYSMESNLQEMKGEYEMIVAEKEKSNSVKFQGKMLMAAITGIEFLNNRFDPFDVKLDGWGEQVNENIDDYDDIFGELHEKYKSKAKMAPELKLFCTGQQHGSYD